MDDTQEPFLEEELMGEEYGPNYLCMKRESPEEEICESTVSSCTAHRTTTGNILERMITDPTCRRPPRLADWPVCPPKSESDFQENIHQHRANIQPTTLAQMCSLRVTSEPNTFRQPAIVGTIGAASSHVNGVLELLEAGVNIIRISMTHMDPCFQQEPFRNAVEASNQFKTMKDFDIPIGIMVDLKGPEIRTGNIDTSLKIVKNKSIFLKGGSHVRLTVDDIFENRCTDKMIYVDYACLLKQATVDMIIYISDQEIILKVDAVEKTSLDCTVEKEGYLRSNQKVHIPNLPQILPAVTEYDRECLELAVTMEVDIISVPNTRNEIVIMEIRNALEELQENNCIKILATIASYEGLENIDCILKFADGIIIQKNDLSLDIAPEKMFVAQKEIIGKCNRLGKPVLCTARLSSVETLDKISQRIEMNDIGGAIFDGADGIILISETALGDQGVQAVTQLSSIIREAEAATMQKPFYFDLADEFRVVLNWKEEGYHFLFKNFRKKGPPWADSHDISKTPILCKQVPSVEPSRAIALAAVQIANKIQASAILAVTTSGRTAQMLSWFRPRRPVIAITRVGKVARQMSLWRAIIPLHFSAPLLPDYFQDVKARFEYGIAYGKNCGIIESGDLLVLVSGFRKNAGFTNSIRIVFASISKDTFVDNVSQYYNQSVGSA